MKKKTQKRKKQTKQNQTKNPLTVKEHYKTQAVNNNKKGIYIKF